jgi:hypothetical protein
MFSKQPKYKNLSELVKMSSVEEARVSAQELLKHFRSLKQRKYKVATKRATVLAANRANAQLARKNLSKQKSDDFREIEMIFRNAAKQMML